MTLYFAYGSNMSSARLRARVGAVDVEGRAFVVGHEHQFSKAGSDGTGKGHIAPHPSRSVHGVVYALTDEQLARLAQFEGGYAATSLPVSVATGTIVTATTFVALRPCDAPPPSPAYLDHYRRGFLEHAIPRAYALAVLRDAGDTRPM
ncbi:MAG: gamma-glutamylcyclotransferase family protein [Myxococcota bacterium]